MSRQFVVIGTGRFGSAVARTLHDLGHEVVAVDASEEALAHVLDDVTHAAVVDATDERALREMGLADADTVIVAIGENLQASILATVTAKAAGAPYVISKANDRTAARVLASVGADEVVRPEHDMGVRLAEQLAAPDQIGALQLGDEHSVVELHVRDRLSGSLAELALPKRFGTQVLAVHRGPVVQVVPGADFEVLTGDRLVVIGHNDDIERLRQHVAR